MLAAETVGNPTTDLIPYLEVISKVEWRFKQAAASPNGTNPRSIWDGGIMLVTIRQHTLF